MLKYVSTRDESIVVSFEEAICGGYAPDGGLFVPQVFPKNAITPELLRNQWSRLSYVDLAYECLRHFIDVEEISNEDLKRICVTAFEGFTDADNAVPVLPLRKKTEESTSLYMAELFHGPTFCFKDLGMRVMVGLLSHFATMRQRRVTLIVSTTGDTGPAAVQAVADIQNPLLSIVVHYPNGQISEFQRRQLTTIQSKQVKIVAFCGGGDDMDRPIKNMLTTSKDKSEDWLWCGVNSYNIGRPLMQLVHFVWIYLRAMEQTHQQETGNDSEPPPLSMYTRPMDMILPTGAMGNIAGGYMAKQMGLPIRKLVASVNVNDITHRVIQTGHYVKSAKMLKTLSDAINIQMPYNVERLLFYLTECRHDLVKQWMTSIDKNARMELDSTWHSRLQQDFKSARITDEEMCHAMQAIYDDYQYFADPHTSVAVAGALKLGYISFTTAKNNDGTTDNKQEEPLPVTAILSTASPIKFQESVTVGLGEEGWKKFIKEGQFPPKALDIMQMDEVAPLVYEPDDSKTLEQLQTEREAETRSLIAESFGK